MSVSMNLQFLSIKQPDRPTPQTALKIWKIAPPVIEAMRIEIAPNGLAYPYPNMNGGFDSEARRLKTLNNPEYKYLASGKPANRPLYYLPTLERLIDDIAHRDGLIYLSESDKDIWAGLSAGITNIVGTYGAACNVQQIAELFSQWAVKRVFYIPDNDSGGQQLHTKLDAILPTYGIELDARYSAGGDLADLWGMENWRTADFVAMLDSLPPANLPDVVINVPTPQPRPTPSNTHEANVQAKIDAVWPEIIAYFGNPDFTGKGFTRKKVRSPFRPDNRPSLHLNNRTFTAVDMATGETYTAKQLCSVLGIAWPESKPREKLATAPDVDLPRLQGFIAHVASELGQTFTRSEFTDIGKRYGFKMQAKRLKSLLDTHYHPVEKKGKKGRPSLVYSVSGIETAQFEIGAYLSTADYRAALMCDRPNGQYTRAKLARESGVSKRTTYTYQHRQGVKSEARYQIISTLQTVDDLPGEGELCDGMVLVACSNFEATNGIIGRVINPDGVKRIIPRHFENQREKLSEFISQNTPVYVLKTQANYYQFQESILVPNLLVFSSEHITSNSGTKITDIDSLPLADDDLLSFGDDDTSEPIPDEQPVIEHPLPTSVKIPSRGYQQPTPTGWALEFMTTLKDWKIFAKN